MGFSEKLQEYFHPSWYSVLKGYIESPEFFRIAVQISEERRKNYILPPKDSELFLKIFKILPYNEVKVVCLGQDPYHSDDQYDGIAFSNSTLDKPQPSLANILEEVENDIYDGFNLERITNYSLYNWVEQGVFLVNAAHTVVRGRPASHMHYWKNFTIEVVKALNEKDNVVWLMWGKFSQSFKQYITNPTHRTILTSHPSPLSVWQAAPIPFRDSKCFSKCNEYLTELNQKNIIW